MTMTKEEIIKMAKQAGFERLGHTAEDWVCHLEDIEEFIKLVADKAIKEALAKEKALQALHDENERLGLYKDAYAEQEPVVWQEPVAWQVMVEDEAMKEFSIKDMAHDWCVQQKLSGSSYIYWIRPLYTTPPQRKPLTDEDVERIVREARVGEHGIGYTIARAIEAAHGIKE